MSLLFFSVLLFFTSNAIDNAVPTIYPRADKIEIEVDTISLRDPTPPDNTIFTISKEMINAAYLHSLQRVILPFSGTHFRSPEY